MATGTYPEASSEVAEVEIEEDDVKNLFWKLKKPVAPTWVWRIVRHWLASYWLGRGRWRR